MSKSDSEQEFNGATANSTQTKTTTGQKIQIGQISRWVKLNRRWLRRKSLHGLKTIRSLMTPTNLVAALDLGASLILILGVCHLLWYNKDKLHRCREARDAVEEGKKWLEELKRDGATPGMYAAQSSKLQKAQDEEDKFCIKYDVEKHGTN